MKKILNLYKPLGMTPLEAINEFKKIHKEYKSKKMTYPGRLDPLAEGVLIVLVEDECKKMKQYMKLDKEYEADILLGISSDTHDVLGLAEREITEEDLNIKEIKKHLKSFRGEYEFQAPSYSSIKVQGKPMFYYARHGKLKEIENPVLKVKIHNITIEKIYSISSHRLLKEILKKIDLVKGDFRQFEIKENWKRILDIQEKKYTVIKTSISCSSGTYIRAIARDFGKKYNGALLLNLKRTQVGSFKINQSIKLRNSRIFG